MIQLKNYEKTIFSQSGEDGILEFLVRNFKIDKTYVEFGVEDSTQCNTRYLRHYLGFDGLWMDMGYENQHINLWKERVHRDNVISLFEKYNVFKNFGVLSIDIDGNDFHVLKQILKNYIPQIIVLEYNAIYNWNDDKIIQYDENFYFDGTEYFGASLLSFTKLCNDNNYSLIYTTNLGVNAFFIHNSLLDGKIEFENINDVEKLYNPYRYVPKPGIDPLNRKFLKYDDTL